jgi:hypothetical protein
LKSCSQERREFALHEDARRLAMTGVALSATPEVYAELLRQHALPQERREMEALRGELEAGRDDLIRLVRESERNYETLMAIANAREHIREDMDRLWGMPPTDEVHKEMRARDLLGCALALKLSALINTYTETCERLYTRTDQVLCTRKRFEDRMGKFLQLLNVLPPLENSLGWDLGLILPPLS